MKDILLLIDANSLIHRAFHALPPLTAPDGRPTGALYGLSSILLKILKERRPKYVAAAFDSPGPTFRDKEFAEYKATRPPTAETLVPQLEGAKELLKTFGVKTFELPGFEADDLVATLAKKFGGTQNLQIIVLSGDLDVLQTVKGDEVVVEMPQKGISNTTIYNDGAVRERFGVSPKELADYKGLVGDKSDNIPGVSGIGPKTASELIHEFGGIERIYEGLEQGGIKNKRLEDKLSPAKETALLSKRLATLISDCPLEVGLDELEFKKVDKRALSHYFSELGFQSLVERLNKNIIE